MLKKLFFIFSFASLFPNLLFAKAIKVPLTETRYMKSKFNKVDYKIFVSLPIGYKESKEKYPVVYLLDGQYSFLLSRNIVKYMTDREFLPKFILVGISYLNQKDTQPSGYTVKEMTPYKINRTRDYTPIQSIVDDEPHSKFSGGGDLFAKFINKELIPYIAKRYKVNTNRTLVGHSYGGLFATSMSLQDGNKFSNYIIISPSFWYKDRYIFSILNEKFKNMTEKKIYFAIGKETEKMNKGMDDFIAKINEINSKNENKIEYEYSIFDKEDHHTIYQTAFTHGILNVFKK